MSNIKDNNSVNLNSEKYSLGIKVTSATEIAPSIK